ncbi:MAG: transcriptional modulator of MazE/toxin MazF, partial [Microgenomates group bacterium Gr01-1014_93]
MERFVKGDIIVIEFPYSNLKDSKRRPVLILKVPKGEDIIILQITSPSYEKSVEIPIKKEDFKQGNLKRDSHIRIDKIASIDKSLMKYKIGSLKQEKFSEILEELRKGEPEIAALLIASEHDLEVFCELDYTHGWLTDRIKMKGEDSWAYFQSRIEAEPEKKEQIINFALGDLDHKEKLIKSSAIFRQFTAKVLDTYFDTSDTSNWRKFLRNYFSIVMAGFRYGDPEEYNPEAQYQRLQELFQAVGEEDWSFLAGYFVLSGWARSGKAIEVLDPQVLKGDLDSAKAFLEFNNIIKFQNPENLFYGDEGKAINFWLKQFADGSITPNTLVDIANTWISRRKALFSHEEPYRAEIGFALVPLLTNPETYTDGELVAQLTYAGVTPDEHIKQGIRDGRVALEPIKKFGRAISELVKGDFHSDMLPIVCTWVKRFIEGDVSQEDLGAVAQNIGKIKAGEDGLTKNGEISDVTKEYFKHVTKILYVIPNLAEIEDVDVLMMHPDAIPILMKQDIFPTTKVLEYLAVNGKNSIDQLLELIRSADDGNFDPKNDLQRDLQFSRYLAMVGTYDISVQYERFQKLPFADQIRPPQLLSGEDLMEIECTALEAARVYWLIKERVDAGRNVLVVANERYGKLFVIDPLFDELKSLGVRVESTYVRSGAAKEGKVEKVFDDDLEQHIREELPDIFVVDGTATPIGHGEQKPRFTRAMIAFHKWFSESNLGYNIGFWSFLEGDEVQLGDTNVEFKRPVLNGPQIIIVNSTVDPKHTQHL